MAMLRPWLLQFLQIALVAVLAPLLTGLVRKIKARMLGRRGPSPLQPYRDLLRLVRKQPVAAESASWLFFAAPYVSFAALWLAASLVPGFGFGLPLEPAADLIALIGLLGLARFAIALAGLDVGTSFGGIGSSREMMIASLAEPAMLMIVFTLALLMRTTALSGIADFILTGGVGIRVSLLMGLIALAMVAIAETGRIPVDNPATHLELTMVHEAMVLEYSGRHLALIEAGQMLKLLFYVTLIGVVFAPWGMADSAETAGALALGLLAWLGKLGIGAVALAVFETSIAKMRVFRVAEFLGGALLFAVLATFLLYVSRGL